MSEFTDGERDFLQRGERRLGRLATVGADGAPHVVPVGYSYNADLDAIDVGGIDLTRTKKYRDIGRNPRVAIVVDEVLPPWQTRGIEVRGHAEAVAPPEPVIRIHPERIVSWGIESSELGRRHGRDVTRRPPHAAPHAPDEPAAIPSDVAARYQVIEVLHAVEIAIDRRDIDGFARHFTHDAHYESPFGEHDGRGAIAEMSRAHHAAGSMDGKRRMTGPAVVELSDDRGRAHAYSHWWIAEAADHPAVYSSGTYTDSLRNEAGIWRIEHRRQTIDPSWAGTPPAPPDARGR